MMNFKIKSTAGAENFTATADLFVERNWNKSALLLTFVATDKSKCRPHRAVERKSNHYGTKQNHNAQAKAVERKSNNDGSGLRESGYTLRLRYTFFYLSLLNKSVQNDIIC